MQAFHPRLYASSAGRKSALRAPIKAGDAGPRWLFKGLQNSPSGYCHRPEAIAGRNRDRHCDPKTGHCLLGRPGGVACGQLRPDGFRAVIGLSVPFRARGPVPPTSVMPRTDDAVWYQHYFHEPGIAEAEHDRNVRTSFRIGRSMSRGMRAPILSIVGEPTCADRSGVLDRQLMA